MSHFLCFTVYNSSTERFAVTTNAQKHFTTFSEWVGGGKCPFLTMLEGGHGYMMPRSHLLLLAGSATLILYEHVYSPTRQRHRQRQIVYSWLKRIVNSSYTVS